MLPRFSFRHTETFEGMHSFYVNIFNAFVFKVTHFLIVKIARVKFLDASEDEGK